MHTGGLGAACRFIRHAGDDAEASWEQRVAKQYYDRLYKEYCLADLKHYKSGQVRGRACAACLPVVLTLGCRW